MVASPPSKPAQARHEGYMSELPSEAPADAGGAPPVYASGDLQRMLDEFEAYLIAEELTPSARFTYVDQARRYVRWLAGDYRPRNAGASLVAKGPRRPAWTLGNLRVDLEAYGDELRAARLKPLAISTYLGRSETFVRWLEGGYESRGPNGAPMPIEEDDSWLDESAIQAHVVAWLKKEGWIILRQASGREHGTDIDAVRGKERLAVEVKGHPRRLHTFGANKGQARKWHPAAQVRTYYGSALHAAVTMLHADTERSVAIALPDVPSYRGLVDRSRDPPRRLGIEIWLVGRFGAVRDV
jgi:Holliday junction resolvase-like predicted endonuclease